MHPIIHHEPNNARIADLHSRFAGVTAEQLRKAYPPGRMSSAGYWLSFARIIDVPFETCVATLDDWLRTGPDGELRIGPSLLRWPIEHDRRYGACRIEAGLARGPLRPPLRMRLDVAPWSTSLSRTALELVPGQVVRPTAAYFRSGHLLLDSLTCSLLPGRAGDGRPELIPLPVATGPAGCADRSAWPLS